VDEPPTIRPATAADFNFVDALQHKWKANIGWLHTSALQAYIHRGCVTLCHSNGWEAAYVIHAPTPAGICRVAQIAVHPDLLRTTLGSQLMRAAETYARAHDQTTIRLKSRTDLPANLFWPELGYTRTATTAPLGPKKLPRHEWTKSLLDPPPPEPIKPPVQSPRPPTPRIWGYAPALWK
jgi:GNAT superfamily N-acetyltransferase